MNASDRLENMLCVQYTFMIIRLLQVFHKLITTGNHRLQSLFDCLLTIIVNGLFPFTLPDKCYCVRLVPICLNYEQYRSVSFTIIFYLSTIQHHFFGDSKPGRVRADNLSFRSLFALISLLLSFDYLLVT